MTYNLSTFMQSINKTKSNLMDDPDAVLPVEDIEKAYVPYIMNRCFSYFPDTLLQAQAMNMRSFLDKRMHYEYLLHAIRKRNRFAPWEKQEQIEALSIVKEFFGYSNQKAKEALRILTPEQIEYIKLKLDKGGRKRK